MKNSIKICITAFFVLALISSCKNAAKDEKIINNLPDNPEEMKGIRYVAIGDSYTIGEGIDRNKAWPVILAGKLNENGIGIKLLANPSRTGWTTQDAIKNEMPVFRKSKPDFATLMIGVNDWVQGADRESFRQSFISLIGQMQDLLSDRSKIIVVTIPDFSATPTGRIYGSGRDISKGISEFNEIIKQESKKRNIEVVDIYPVTQEMAKNRELVAGDGLHPSEKEHKIWSEMIYPVAYKLLKDYRN